MRKLKITAGLAGGLLLLSLAELSSANFVGSYSVTRYSDLNIQDGLVINSDSVDLNIAASTDPQLFQVTLDDGSGPVALPDYLLSTPNRLDQPLRNQDFGLGSIFVDSFFISDGSHMAMAFVTQEFSDPLDIAIAASSWLRSAPTAGNLVGSWNVTFYTDLNVRNTSDGFSQGFASGTFASGGGNTVLIPWDLTQVAVQVDGNTAFLPAPVNTGDSLLHALNISFDQTGFSYFSISSELGDPTDISVTVGYGSPVPVPVPAAAWLFGSGLLGLIGIARREKNIT